MKIYVDTDCVEIENNEQIVLTYEELEILTGSKRLTQILIGISTPNIKHPQKYGLKYTIKF